MKAILKGMWIDIELYNTDLSTLEGEQRMDSIGLTITSHERFGRDVTITEAHLYPEDIQNLMGALKAVQKDALDSRKRFHIKNPYPPREEITAIEIEEDGKDILETFLEEKRKELEPLFKSGEWFEIPRNDRGVADTWGNAREIYEEFMPFVVWNSETYRPEFVDVWWERTDLYREISWNSKYTKMKGII